VEVPQEEEGIVGSVLSWIGW